MRLARKSLFSTTFAAAALLILAAAGVVLAYPWNGLSLIDRWREMRTGAISYSGSRSVREVALTFDDGPDPRYTPRVLEILRRQHVKATFFVVGRMLEKHPELGRRIVADGHAIGNHTETHPQLQADSASDVRRELDGCERDIEAVTGERSYLFRPPRGLWSPVTFKAARRRGYHIVLWSLAFDREAVHYSAILRRRVVRLAKPGDIILMHDGAASKADARAPTIRELDGIITDLKARGFRFVTVPELLRIPGDRPLPAVAVRRM